MDRQDRQGASGLQRHDPDRHLPDGTRSRLGVFREARQAEDHAGAIGRRSIRSTSASAACGAFATRVSAAPPAAPVTPALIAAAQKEGKLAFYTAMDLPVAEKFAKAFEAKYPGIAVRVERSGAERVFQRIGQEMDSNIHAVDIVNTADGAHIIVWTRNGWLAAYVPEDVARYFPKE